MLDPLDEVVDLDSPILEIQESFAHLIQVHNISHSTVMINKGCYLMGRAYALVNPINEYVIDLLQKGTLMHIPTKLSKLKKLQKDKNKSRNKIKLQALREEEKVMNGLGKLFIDVDQNVRQTR